MSKLGTEPVMLLLCSRSFVLWTSPEEDAGKELHIPSVELMGLSFCWDLFAATGGVVTAVAVLVPVADAAAAAAAAAAITVAT